MVIFHGFLALWGDAKPRLLGGLVSSLGRRIPRRRPQELVRLLVADRHLEPGKPRGAMQQSTYFIYRYIIFMKNRASYTLEIFKIFIFSLFYHFGYHCIHHFFIIYFIIFIFLSFQVSFLIIFLISFSFF